MSDSPTSPGGTRIVADEVEGDSRPVQSIPIRQRLPTSKLRTYLTVILFILVLLPIHLAQLFYYPLSFVPGGIRELYWFGIECSKVSFGRLLLLITKPTTLVITGGEGVDLDKVVKKDPDSGKWMLNLEDRAVYMSNHQQYADWCYMFCFMYLADSAGSLVILLKSSLRNVPMAGPAMRLWKFIFLAPGQWATDRAQMGHSLHELGRRAQRHGRKLSLLLYPEGTLVSKLTRPRSQKYAEKLGVPDMKNQLLPRSTGLLFSLRTLKQHVPDLALYDLTVGYPNMPAAAFAQSYYTLSSIYTASQGPAQVHIHLRRYELPSLPTQTLPLNSPPAPAAVEPVAETETETLDAPPQYSPENPIVPIGINSFSSTAAPVVLDDALTKEEREAFDVWVRERWTEKDKLLDGFYQKGEFEITDDSQRREIKLEFRSIDDWLALLANYIAVYVAIRLCFYLPRWSSTLFALARARLGM